MYKAFCKLSPCVEVIAFKVTITFFIPKFDRFVQIRTFMLPEAAKKESKSFVVIYVFYIVMDEYSSRLVVGKGVCKDRTQ